MSQQQESEQRVQFLLKVLQLLIAKNYDSQVVNLLLQQSLDLLDDEMMEVLRDWAKPRFLRSSQEDQYSKAFALVNFGDLLRQLLLGNTAVNIELSIRCYSIAAQIFSPVKNHAKWIEIQNSLALSYKERIRGNKADNLEASIEYYRFVLKSYEDKKDDLELAEAQNNLSIAYIERILGDKDENIKVSIKYCKLAQEILITFFMSLQEFYSPEDYSIVWAINQNNLANSYKERLSGDRKENLKLSIESFKLAMKVYNENLYPIEWAKIQNDVSKASEQLVKEDGIDEINVSNGLRLRIANAYYNRGFLKEYKLNNLTKALYDYNKAIKLNPENLQVYLNRNNLSIHKTENTEDSVDDCYQPLTIIPPSILFETVRINEGGIIEECHESTLQKFVDDLGNGIYLSMVKIPAGQFMMGSSISEKERASNESPQHQIKVPEFYMGQTLVTQAQWETVMDFNPSGFRGDNILPVDSVTWLEAMDFCQKLSQKTGHNYRLPNEAEWEYACRAGTETPFAFGENITSAKVNHDGRYPYAGADKGEYRGKTSPVASFPANLFNLYDMHGNLLEWCLDEWIENYREVSSDGRSRGDINSRNRDKLRLLRGGSWRSNARHCRSAHRNYDAASLRINDIGLRVVLVPVSISSR
jgi:formylglycine-generating enzyme required for sulfatase activity